MSLGTNIPAATIALVVTMIRFCIEEYKDGFFEGTTFTETTWRSTYYSHMQNLKALEKESADCGLYFMLTSKLLSDAQCAAGVSSEVQHNWASDD
ncbi:unnamed protein product [Somion occarium]|uniref:DUF6532 domain-containing protein n=1 Tax=Somion occarium TaxID=3059160 RepID=A0ABP1DZB6_9APHY